MRISVLIQNFKKEEKPNFHLYLIEKKNQFWFKGKLHIHYLCQLIIQLICSIFRIMHSVVG
jgi:hypothetical protein